MLSVELRRTKKVEVGQWEISLEILGKLDKAASTLICRLKLVPTSKLAVRWAGDLGQGTCREPSNLKYSVVLWKGNLFREERSTLEGRKKKREIKNSSGWDAVWMKPRQRKWNQKYTDTMWRINSENRVFKFVRECSLWVCLTSSVAAQVYIILITPSLSQREKLLLNHTPCCYSVSW